MTQTDPALFPAVTSARVAGVPTILARDMLLTSPWMFVTYGCLALAIVLGAVLGAGFCVAVLALLGMFGWWRLDVAVKTMWARWARERGFQYANRPADPGLAGHPLDLPCFTSLGAGSLLCVMRGRVGGTNATIVPWEQTHSTGSLESESVRLGGMAVHMALSNAVAVLFDGELEAQPRRQKLGRVTTARLTGPRDESFVAVVPATGERKDVAIWRTAAAQPVRASALLALEELPSFPVGVGFMQHGRDLIVTRVELMRSPAELDELCAVADRVRSTFERAATVGATKVG